ncbi:lysine--tRNA ligase [Candidatus Saccharibacteria bacterium]|nr:lysine--tRNA ligase [Candidatus Saccharibacteria bacterium]
MATSENHGIHWADRIAETIITREPGKEEYVCASGISPSGSVHVGNFRDVATSYFVCLALRKRGKKARLLFSWDEQDRFRKVPKNIPEDKIGLMSKHIGFSLAETPDPFGCHDSYAKHFEEEFEESMAHFKMDIDYKYQAAQYKSGKYTEGIITALKNRYKIFDILEGFRTQNAEEGQRENYYPVSIYCANCHRDTTKILSLNEETMVAQYECKCGYRGEFDFHTDHDCKLVWKVDWPMRWQYEGVDYEPAGKDHGSDGGSRDVSVRISREIYGFEPPVFQMYEFVGIRGLTGKMSGSSGINITPKTMLDVYQPEIILWLYSRFVPNKAFNLCFDDEILKQYFEFDRALSSYYDGTADDLTSRVIEYSLIPGRKIVPVPMNQLASFGSIVNFNAAALENIFAKIGAPYKTADFSERLRLAKNWLEEYSPDSIVRLNPEFNREYFDGLSESEKTEIEMLHQYLSGQEPSSEDLRVYLYEIPKTVNSGIDGKELRKAQSRFFKNVYQMLIGRDSGPRLYMFLGAIDKSAYLHLLNGGKEK